MIITCPQCLTQFRLDDDLLLEGRSRLRCSRCRHVFDAEKKAAGVGAAPPRKEAPAAEPAAKAPEARLAEAETAPAEMPRRSRRRGISLTLLIILVVLAGAGYGVLELWDRSPDLREFLFRLTALKQIVGLRDEGEGFISLERVRGYYLENAKRSRIFVVEGHAVNHWNEPRSFIKIRGALFDSRGNKVEEKVVFCGNILSEKDLKEWPLETIERSLSSQFGESFTNVNIPPRKPVPFMIVFSEPAGEKTAPPPGGAAEASSGLSDFTVEVVGSQKGSRK